MIILSLGLLAGCAEDDPATVVGIEAAEGFEVTEVVTGLSGPTQLTTLPDGPLLVAELAGGESDGIGRIVAIDADGTRETLFEDLLTPTGVAVVGDEIWVMEERTLSRGPLAGGELTAVLGPLPFNGRSETTLTATGDGTLYYGTSGALRGGEVVEGSGILWEHDPGSAPGSGSTAVSAGFKNAYAHTVDGDGRLWVTEISDGTFDGAAAPDELVEVIPGVDHGWPTCIGDRVAVAEFGADPDECAAGPRSHALFAAGATPTSVAVAPWDADTLVVALWVERRVVTVPRFSEGAPHEPVDLLTGEDLRPQHLLADGDRLLVVDHDGGRILAVAPYP